MVERGCGAPPRHAVRRVEVGIGADARDREWDDSDANLFRAYLTWRHQF
jgi:hypothetical protein